MVDAFHAAALAGRRHIDGAPGLRPQYGEGYYAAFVRDPDGNRIEAVTFVASRASVSVQPVGVCRRHGTWPSGTAAAAALQHRQNVVDLVGHQQLETPCRGG